MSTLIEIFDSTQYENIITPIRLAVDRLIYIGTKDIMTTEKVDDLRSFFKRINFGIPIEFHYVDRSSADSIRSKLISLTNTYPDAVFDATGGEDLLLVQVGAVAERYSVPIIRIDSETKKLSFLNDASIPFVLRANLLSVEDLITLEGGRVVSSRKFSSFSYGDMEDIKTIFEINGVDCDSYTSVSNYVTERFSDDEKTFILDKESFADFIKDSRYNKRGHIFNLLVTKGFIKKTYEDSRSATYEMKSPTVAACLKKSGNILEYYTAVGAASLNNLSDINIGIKIEWDISAKQHETQNEIDVMAVKSDIPIFISCKNGEVKKEALYELDSVAEALGGPYARKILVCSYLSESAISRNNILERAKDMGIFVIFNTHLMKFDRFTSLLHDSLTFDFDE